MPVIVSVNLTGVEAIKERYSRQHLMLARQAGLRAALDETANQAQKSADDLVYSKSVEWDRTGEYEASLHVGGEGNISHTDIGADIIVFGSNVEQATYLEFGTPPHQILPRAVQPALGSPHPHAGGTRFLAFMSHGELFIRPSVMHPGMQARGVLGHAIDVGGQAINEAYTDAFFAALGVRDAVRTFVTRTGGAGGRRSGGIERAASRMVRSTVSVVRKSGTTKAGRTSPGAVKRPRSSKPEISPLVRQVLGAIRGIQRAERRGTRTLAGRIEKRGRMR